LYFDSAIEDYGRAYEIMGQIPGMKQFLKVKEIRDENGNIKRWAADPQRLYWMQQMRPVMDILPVLDSISSKAGWQKSKTAKDLYKSSLAWATGMNLTTSDPVVYARILQRDAIKKALQEGRMEGIIKTHESYYMQKGMMLPEEEMAYYRQMMQAYQDLSRGRRK